MIHIGRLPNLEKTNAGEIQRDGEKSQAPILVPVYGGHTSGWPIVMETLRSLPLRKEDTKNRGLVIRTIRANLISSMQFLWRLVDAAGLDRQDSRPTLHARKTLELERNNQTSDKVWNFDMCHCLRLLQRQLDSLPLDIHRVEEDYRAPDYDILGVRRGDFVRLMGEHDSYGLLDIEMVRPGNFTKAKMRSKLTC